jgi:hypothetical protein
MATQSSTIWDVIDEIGAAWRSGRTIVPLIGAGISADSGIPIVRSIVRYFGKFQQLIENNAYFASRPEAALFSQETIKRYHSEPWEYVQAFGWPDRFQLNQDLYHAIGQSKGREEGMPQSITGAAQLGLDRALNHINPNGVWTIRELVSTVIRDQLAYNGVDKTRAVEVVKCVSSYLEKHFIDRGSHEYNIANHELKECLAGLDRESERTSKRPLGVMIRKIIDAFAVDNTKSSVPFNLSGDWKRLIQYFTNYQGDLADSLISRLCAGRGPALGHQYVAYLARLLNTKLILTYNFDDLIERSLLSQGVIPRIFGLEEGVRLPPETLVRDSVSVFKLHGNNHALLLDERVDHPLTLAYKERFDRLVGKNPLLLIIGCSGGDMRVRDLFHHVVKNNGGAVWLHFESEPPECVTKFLRGAGEEGTKSERKGAKIISARTNNPGADLMHIYIALSGGHPAAGTISYPINPTRPSPIPGTQVGGMEPTGNPLRIDPEKWKEAIKPENRAVILATPGAGERAPDRTPTDSASQALLRVADHWLREGYQIVWVDLESVHTISGVVGAILDQCRSYDIHLAPSVLPSDEPNP